MLYKKEKKTVSLRAEQFVTYLQGFYEDSPEILLFDHQKEFDKILDQNFKQETDANYDPFRERIEETLKQYQELYDKDEFQDEAQKQAIFAIIKDLRRQLDEIDKM